MTQTALILGASGKNGRYFSAAFRAAGWQIRIYKRGTDMNAAARGCDVIVNGMNPPAYHDWQNILPAITAQVIEAAKVSGATILFPGNVYVYGDQAGPWSADTAHKPCSRKGKIRQEVEATYRAAASEGVQTIILRAGDYLEPEVGDTVADAVHFTSLSKGVVTALGDPGVNRAYAWLPDLARAGVMLAQMREDLPKFNDLSLPGLTFSMTELTQEIERQTGRSMRIKQFPWWLFRVASPFWELAREMMEMRYLFSTPHSLSGEHFKRLLPDFRPTPFGQVVALLMEKRLPKPTRA